MEPKDQPDVLVVGAGPVGMVAAACVARQGLGVQVLDQGFRPAARSYSLALHPQSLRLLDELGLARRLLAKGQVVETIAFYDRRRRCSEICLSELGGAFPQLLVLAQSDLEGILSQHLAERKVPVFWNHRAAALQLDAAPIDVDIETLVERAGDDPAKPSPIEKKLKTRARFVVGADGYRSVVRRALGISYRDLGGAATFGIFELRADWPRRREVRIVLDDNGISVLWPLGDDRFRWSFELTDTRLPPPRLKRRLLLQLGDEAFPYLAERDLEDLIAERAPWFDTTVLEVIWSMAVRFDRRLVDRFGDGNAWLLGDAAHLAEPVAGHSMNVGLREAHDLARRFAEIVRGGDSRRLLAEYNERRLTEWRTLLGVAGEPAGSTGGDDWIAANAARIAVSIPASGDDLRQLTAQLGVTL